MRQNYIKSAWSIAIHPASYNANTFPKTKDIRKMPPSRSSELKQKSNTPRQNDIRYILKSIKLQVSLSNQITNSHDCRITSTPFTSKQQVSFRAKSYGAVCSYFFGVVWFYMICDNMPNFSQLVKIWHYFTFEIQLFQFTSAPFLKVKPVLAIFPIFRMVF